MKKKKINIIVLTQSTPLALVASSIKSTKNLFNFLLLSTHKLFETEKEEIQNNINRVVIFKTFADFLSDKEMAWCDKVAYEEMSKKYNSNFNAALVGEYFSIIKTKKNRTALNNILKKYELQKKILLADDLGIDSKIWENESFEISLIKKSTTAQTKVFKKIRSLLLLKPLLSRIKKFKRFKQRCSNIIIIENAKKKYLFLTPIKRVEDKLSFNKIKIKRKFISLNSFFKTYLKSILKYRKFGTIEFGLVLLNKIKDEEGDFKIATTIHEYNCYLLKLAKRMGVKLVVLQDGFLPENYSSYYLKFFKNVDKFFCWDESSKKIFAKFSLPVEIAPFLDMKLPAIKMKNYPVNTIVVLTSGAGDWTALKNRSDQDLEVEAFAKVAKEFPNINIIFRCHPLWAHKKHQGTNSINRVDKYYKSLNLKNIRISEESLKQADYFKKTGNLWIEKKSADKDINEGNLFFGEHSIAMIDAAKKSKIFASVNLTNRRNFFINYSKLGFPNLTSVEEVIDFIKKIREKNEVINSFNKAVEKYNEQFKN